MFLIRIVCWVRDVNIPYETLMSRVRRSVYLKANCSWKKKWPHRKLVHVPKKKNNFFFLWNISFLTSKILDFEIFRNLSRISLAGGGKGSTIKCLLKCLKLSKNPSVSKSKKNISNFFLFFFSSEHELSFCGFCFFFNCTWLWWNFLLHI